jgi:hypothetical protein
LGRRRRQNLGHHQRSFGRRHRRRRQSTTTDDQGNYSFPVLPVGDYVLEVSHPGFDLYRRTGIVLDTNSALLIDAVLKVGGRNDAVTVNDSAVHLETDSSQVGEVIDSDQMTAVPLNGRSYTDLLSLQPGVAPETSINSNTVQDVGATALSPSGNLNPGTVSINGQREFANAFIVNGSDSEEDVNMGTAIIPNLDSIAEFRILTSNFDAEYGEFSGGQINVITKSGSNNFHGDLFEFLRNTDLLAHAWHLYPKSIRRHRGRPHPPEQSLLLLRLSGNPPAPGRGHRFDPRPFKRRARRRFLEPCSG